MSSKLRLPADVVKLMLLAEKLADRYERILPTIERKNLRRFQKELLDTEDWNLLYQLRIQIEEIVRGAEPRTPRVDIGLPVSEEPLGTNSLMFIDKLINREWVSDSAAALLRKKFHHLQ